MNAAANLLDELRSRQLLVQHTPEEALIRHLSQPRTVYCGFDPTADSLHIGHLVPLLALQRFQNYGHRPVALIGGATGLVGDPSFKAAERSANDAEVVAAWARSIELQVRRLLGHSESSGLQVMNNMEWFKHIHLLPFLRDVGKGFSINSMVRKESVRQRLERDGEGISFTEFTYMILQAYDFAELNRRFGCSIQIGGSDQWGNITCGIDLCRRQNQAEVHALTFPLVTKADGSKFGKTEKGTVWLDSTRTSPYAFFQFWVNTQDSDVYRFLRYFTFLPAAEIREVEESDRSSGTKPEAQRILAQEVTRFVHGRAGLESALRISDALFSERLQSLSEADIEQLALDGMPCSDLVDAGVPLTRLLVDAGLAQNGKQVKDALSRGAVSINGRAYRAEQNLKMSSEFTTDHALFGRYFFVKLGKRSHHLFKLR